MWIELSPVRLDAAIEVAKAGDNIVINGDVFDFTRLPDGATLPASAIESDHFVGDVSRINGELHLTIRLPHGPNPSHAVAFPAVINVAADGPVALPSNEGPIND